MPADSCISVSYAESGMAATLAHLQIQTLRFSRSNDLFQELFPVHIN